jgi:hypothetical protein
MMQQKPNAGKRPLRNRRIEGRTPGRSSRLDGLHRQVKLMAAAGLVEDQIALRLGGMDKNRLRKKYIDAIKEGRAVAANQEAQAAAEELPRKERELLDRIERSFESHWFDDELGNLLYGGARSVEEALEWLAGTPCRKNG